MPQKAMLQQLLDDMDSIRPIILEGMPDHRELRVTTRRMIANMETMQQKPSVPTSIFLWLSQLTSKFLDAEHGALLGRGSNGELSDSARIALETHAKERQTLLMDAVHNIPAARQILDQCCILIGQKPTNKSSIQDKARHLNHCLQTHLKQESELRRELQQLVEAFSPSMDAISSLLKEAGEDSPELQQAKQLLDQDLPDDASEAREMLQRARQGIMQAGVKLTTASEKLQTTIHDNVEKLSEMSNKLAKAEADACNDPLTGLANRRQLAKFLDTMDTVGFCFVITDIDYFKKINDTYGHDAGDQILQQLSTILQDSVRSTDLAARIGGEEFCIVFPGTPLETAIRLAESLRQTVATHPFNTGRENITVNVSLGIAKHQENASHAATFKAADNALYQAKKGGRNQVCVAEDKGQDT